MTDGMINDNESTREMREEKCEMQMTNDDDDDDGLLVVVCCGLVFGVWCLCFVFVLGMMMSAPK